MASPSRRMTDARLARVGSRGRPGERIGHVARDVDGRVGAIDPDAAHVAPTNLAAAAHHGQQAPGSAALSRPHETRKGTHASALTASPSALMTFTARRAVRDALVTPRSPGFDRAHAREARPPRRTSSTPASARRTRVTLPDATIRSARAQRALVERVVSATSSLVSAAAVRSSARARYRLGAGNRLEPVHDPCPLQQLQGPRELTGRRENRSSSPCARRARCGRCGACSCRRRSGGSTWMTRAMSCTSIPRAATSVATRTRSSPCLNAASARLRAACSISPDSGAAWKPASAQLARDVARRRRACARRPASARRGPRAAG